MIMLAGRAHAISLAGDSTGWGAMAVVRTQLQSIAEEAADSAKVDVQRRVAIVVDGDGPKSAAENAFIEAMQKRNVASIVMDSSLSHQILHVFLLHGETTERAINEKFSLRCTRTALEVKTLNGAEREVRMLGTFMRETTDTVNVRSTGILPADQKKDDQGLLQRMLTPFIVVGGAIVIVYLFFTVRS